MPVTFSFCVSQVERASAFLREDNVLANHDDFNGYDNDEERVKLDASLSFEQVEYAANAANSMHAK